MRRQRVLGPDDSRAPVRRKTHGISADERDALAAVQGFACAICRRTGLRLELDHDHRHCSGRLGCRLCARGLLCARCNSGLGLIGDAHVDQLVRYLTAR